MYSTSKMDRANRINSDLEEDKAMIPHCVFELQQRMDFPEKITNPPIDLLVIGSPAKSLREYVFSSSGPYDDVPTR